ERISGGGTTRKSDYWFYRGADRPSQVRSCRPCSTVHNSPRDCRRTTPARTHKHLTLQRDVRPPLLPGPHLASSDADDHGPAITERRFESLWPGKPRDQIPAVEEYAEA